MLHLQCMPCSAAHEQEHGKRPLAAAQMHGNDSAMDTSGIGGEMGIGGELDSTRKLVILGLPWDTTEGSLERHFSQIGPLQARALPPCCCTAGALMGLARWAGLHACKPEQCHQDQYSTLLTYPLLLPKLKQVKRLA